MNTPIFDRILLKIPKQQVTKEKTQQDKKRQEEIIQEILLIGSEILRSQPYHEESFGNLRSLNTLQSNEFSFNETIDRSSIVTQADCFFQEEVMSTRTVLKQTARHNMTMESQTTHQEGIKKKQQEKKKLSPSRYTRLYDEAMNKMKKTKDLPKEMLEEVKSSREKTVHNKTEKIENFLKQKSNSAERTQEASRATIHKLHNSLERQTLYERAIKQKEKHQNLVTQQKNQNLLKQLSGLTFKPAINKTVKVQGQFEERMAKAQKKSTIHRAKLMQEQLDKHKQKNMSFMSKWNTTESKIKTVWSKPTTFYESYYDAAYNH